MPPQPFQFKHVLLLGPGLRFVGVDLSYCFVVLSCFGFWCFHVLILVFAAFIPLICLRCRHPMALQRGCRAGPQYDRGLASCRCWVVCFFLFGGFFVIFLACSFAYLCLRQRPPTPASRPDGREENEIEKIRAHLEAI